MYGKGGQQHSQFHSDNGVQAALSVFTRNIRRYW